MKFCKVRKVKSPTRGSAKSAGIDFYIPEFSLNDKSSISNTIGLSPEGKPCLILHPLTDILIPSGIKLEIPEGFMLMGADKSGVATTKWACLSAGRAPKATAFESPVIIGAKIIDEDYQGELHIHLINTGREKIYLTPGMKIAQFILVPVSYEELIEVRPDELFLKTTARGIGGFGSTSNENE